MGRDLNPDQTREALRVARKEAGLTQAELGGRAAIAQPRLSAFEKGHLNLDAEEIGRLWNAIKSALPEGVLAYTKGSLTLDFFWPPAPNRDISARAKQAMLRANISQEQLAKRSRVTRSKIRAWLKKGDLTLSLAEHDRVWDTLNEAVEQRESRARLAPNLVRMSDVYGSKSQEFQNEPIPRQWSGNLVNGWGEPISQQKSRETREKVMEKLIEAQADLVESLKRLLAVHQEMGSEKDKHIVDLEGRVELLSDLLNVETARSLADSEAEELRERLSKKEPTK